MADQATGLLSGMLRRRRIAAALPHLSGRVLDYGCGAGALAASCKPEDYFGVDLDPASIDAARAGHACHSFEAAVPTGMQFDVIALLAVIEHVDDPSTLLGSLTSHLATDGRIVLTTPHRRAGRFHTIGARLGLFSRAAAAEHTVLFDHARMERTTRACGLRIVHAQRFLMGVNQLFVLKRAITP